MDIKDSLPYTFQEAAKTSKQTKKPRQLLKNGSDDILQYISRCETYIYIHKMKSERNDIQFF